MSDSEARAPATVLRLVTRSLSCSSRDARASNVLEPLAITFLKGTVELEGRNSLGVRDDQQHVVVVDLGTVDVLEV